MSQTKGTGLCGSFYDRQSNQGYHQVSNGHVYPGKQVCYPRVDLGKFNVIVNFIDVLEEFLRLRLLDSSPCVIHVPKPDGTP